MTITLGGLALVGLFATPTLAAPQQERASQGEQPGKPGQLTDQEETRLEFDITSAKELAFRVERRSINPLGSGAASGVGGTGGVGGDQAGQGQPGKGSGGDSMAESPERLRLVLRPQRTSEQQGSSLVLVEVSKDGADALGGPTGQPGDPKSGDQKSGGQSGQAGQSASSSKDQLGSFRVLVDSSGRIVRMEKAQMTGGKAEPGGQTGDKTGGQVSDPLGGQHAFDEDELRTDLTIIFGTGLHEGMLKQGEVYVLGTESPMSKSPIEAGAPASSAGEHSVKAFALRFNAVHDGTPLSGAQPGKEAVFTVLDAKAAKGTKDAKGGEFDSAGQGEDTPGGQGQEPKGQPGDPLLDQQSIGRATYSLQDGLVTRFEARPTADGSHNLPPQGAGGQSGQAGQGGQAQSGVSSQLRATRSWISIERISGS